MDECHLDPLRSAKFSTDHFNHAPSVLVRRTSGPAVRHDSFTIDGGQVEAGRNVSGLQLEPDPQRAEYAPPDHRLNGIVPEER